MQMRFPNLHSSDWSESFSSDWPMPCILIGHSRTVLLGGYNYASPDWTGMVSVLRSKDKRTASCPAVVDSGGINKQGIVPETNSSV